MFPFHLKDDKFIDIDLFIIFSYSPFNICRICGNAVSIIPSIICAYSFFS